MGTAAKPLRHQSSSEPLCRKRLGIKCPTKLGNSGLRASCVAQLPKVARQHSIAVHDGDLTPGKWAIDFAT